MQAASVLRPADDRLTDPNDTPALEDEIRAQLAVRAKTIGVSSIAKEFGVSKTAVHNFIIGRARRGTALLIVTKASKGER